MSIPEYQLEIWSHQGAVTTVRQTHEFGESNEQWSQSC
jgi:hypothetical protein